MVLVEWIRCYSVFFFFKQKTAYEIVSRDWSSDVCSSDLPAKPMHAAKVFESPAFCKSHDYA